MTMLMAFFAGRALYSWKDLQKHKIAYEAHNLISSALWTFKLDIYEAKSLIKDKSPKEIMEWAQKIPETYSLSIPVPTIASRLSHALGQKAMSELNAFSSAIKELSFILIDSSNLKKGIKIERDDPEIRMQKLITDWANPNNNPEAPDSKLHDAMDNLLAKYS